MDHTAHTGTGATSPKKPFPLNERQMDAVNHTYGPALVLAGAGSGKTRVITTRAARLISEGAAPWSILCVTFTNKAAGEMRERIAHSLGMDVSRMWIATFHAACLRILKREHQKLGYETMPAVFDATDQKSLVKNIIKGMGIEDADLPHRKVMGLISKFKNDMRGPEEMAADGSIRAAKTIAEVYFQYQKRLKENNAVDFDDLMGLCITLFENRPDALEAYQKQFEFIMVDEFQDTNAAQYRLIKQLAGERKNVFVVGDDDQSIYRWRGAKVGNIRGFERDFAGCKVVLLEENYRSAGNILSAAGAVVRGIGGRKEKTLWTQQAAGELVTLLSASDEMDEADFIAREIRRQAADGGRRYGDFAIFYRTNAQSRVIEESFNMRGIPYRVYGGLKFYERKEVKDLLAWLRLAVNNSDEISFRRAVAAPPRGIGTTSLDKLKEFAVANSVSLFAACMMENGVSSAARKKLAEFHALVTQIRELAQNDTAREAIQHAVQKTGYLDFLAEKKTAQDNARAENLQELASAAGEEETVAEFLDRATLVSEADLVEEGASAVSIMTLHVSKGLEFPVVFLTGMEEGLLPHRNSMEGMEEMDEERRLCYVGMTRAMKKLYLTHAVSRNIFGHRDLAKPSLFLKDLPEEVVDPKMSLKSMRDPLPRSGGYGGGSGSFGGGYGKPKPRWR
ncbi:MAG: UvrD-helicase domain-containing protein [Nitrospinae bacterium]|nr:UvrD-helicase domain-containing protein [Nitrospinota bacterium]